MKQAHVFISGAVQGVGYRYFVKSNAKQLGLTGWVQNTEDGGVEAVFQSSASSDQEGRAVIEQMLGICKQGPFMAEVKQIGVDWEEPEDTQNEFKVL